MSESYVFTYLSQGPSPNKTLRTVEGVLERRLVGSCWGSFVFTPGPVVGLTCVDPYGPLGRRSLGKGSVPYEELLREERERETFLG